MRDGDGAVLAQEQFGERAPNKVRATDDHRVFTRQVSDVVLQEQQAAQRRAGHDAVPPR